MQLHFIRKKRRPLFFCADVRLVAAKKLMVTKYNTKGQGKDESIFNSCHEPQLSDLRESGSIEQDADIVMFLYRSNYYDKDKESQEETEVVDLSLAKHRNGGIGKIQLAFEKNISRFTNLEASGDDIYAH